jgi:hypothetical protein
MLNHPAATAFEKRNDLFYILIVFLPGNASDAASFAFVYMHSQAWAKLCPKNCGGRDLVFASTQRIDAMNEFYKIAGVENAAVRTEIT